MRIRRLAAFSALFVLLNFCAFWTGCGGKTRPDLVLAKRPEGFDIPSSPTPAASPMATFTPAPSLRPIVADAGFYLSPAEGNTVHSGMFETDLPDETTLSVALRIEPLGGPVTLRQEAAVFRGLVEYDFSDRVPVTAIAPQYAILTLTLHFADGQPAVLAERFGEAGSFLAEGFVTGEGVNARVNAQFALPSPNAEAVARLEAPEFSNPTDLVFATTKRFHRESCRYAKSGELTARSRATALGRSPCGICHP